MRESHGEPSGPKAMPNPDEACSTSSSCSTIQGDETPLKCGYGSCSPGWLQKFHTARCLLVVLCTCAFVQSFVVNAIFPVSLSTLEKRFHMTSTQTGIISSWYDFAVLLVVGPVCHFGTTGHKGRWIGIGSFIMAFGSLVCALPHFIIAPYNPWGMTSPDPNDYGQCTHRPSGGSLLGKPETGNCGNLDSSFLNPYFLVFILGQTLHGIGATPLFSIGTAYIDENVSQKASPVYLAIHSMVTSIGPVVGLFVGGSLLRIYTDFYRVDPAHPIPMKGPSDPRWVGAWWIGFLGCAVAAFINAFPILAFARELPAARHHREKDVNQVHAVSNVAESDVILKGETKHLPKAIWNILRNPTFVVCIVLGIFESIIINGFAMFMPKILETLLSTTPMAASYMSSVVIFAAAAGVMLGGVCIRQMKLQVGGMLKMILVCHVIALLFLVTFLIQCPARKFVGINSAYEGEERRKSILSLDASCNSGCDCNPQGWNPVCAEESGQIYFSACYAGCSNRTQDSIGNDLWSGCRCITNSNTTTAIKTVPKVVGGFCTRECGWPLWVFLALMFISVVASFASGIPSQQILLRVVPFKQRTMAIGVHWYFLRLLGFIPGGVLFGMMIDTACERWQHSPCGKRQSCLVYDPAKLSWTILAVAVVCKLFCILSTIVGYVTYRPNDRDSAISVMTTGSRGALSLIVNDDRPRLMKPQTGGCGGEADGEENYAFYSSLASRPQTTENGSMNIKTI